jgi:hypothetical protein
VDARDVYRELLRLYFGLVLALNEACVLHAGGRRLLLRVTAADTLDAAARADAVGYHCFRGEARAGLRLSATGGACFLAALLRIALVFLSARLASCGSSARHAAM